MPLQSASLLKSATRRCQTRRRWYSNNRRLQVLGDARLSWGISSQRHPVCKTDKIPLTTSRSSARGRPVRAGLGTNRLIRSHWAALTSERYGLRGRPPSVAHHEFRRQLPFFSHKKTRFSWHFLSFETAFFNILRRKSRHERDGKVTQFFSSF